MRSYFEYKSEYNQTRESIKEEIGADDIQHLVGIVCPEDYETGFENAYWPEYTLPLTNGFTMLERCVMECVWAGCESIWVVAKDQSFPIIRDILPEYVVDPYVMWDGYIEGQDSEEYHPRTEDVERMAKIPIYFLRTPAEDYRKREYLSWHILVASRRIREIFDSGSKWFRPDKFYVSFPWGVINPFIAKVMRHTLLSTKKTHCIHHEGDTVKDGKLLSFSFSEDGFHRCKEKIWEMGAGNWKELYRNPEKMSPANVFSELEFDEQMSTDWYYHVSNWNDYIELLRDSPTGLEKPPEVLYRRGRNWDPIGEMREV